MEEQRINIFAEAAPLGPAAQPTQTVISYASIPQRFVALLIDYALIFFPAQFVFWILTKMTDVDLGQLLWLAAGVNVLFILYVAVFSCGGRTTLGKSLVGIAVVNQEETDSIGFFHAFMRAVGYYISAILCMGGFVLAFFDDRKRALHDFLGGSVVINTRPKGTAERLLLNAVGGLLIAALCAFMYYQVFGKGSWVQQAYVSRAQNHLQKMALLEEVHYSLYGYYTNDLLRLSLLSGDPVHFQRDTQKALFNRGFKVGVEKNRFTFAARARDAKHTPVFYASPERK